MTEFYPAHRGEYSIGQMVAGTVYNKIYKLVEVEDVNNLAPADKVVFEDKNGQIITFNGNVIQIITNIYIDGTNWESAKIDTVPYQLNSVYSTTGFPPFQ